MTGAYKVSFECDKQMNISEIKPEGYDLEEVIIKVCFHYIYRDHGHLRQEEVL